MNNTRKFIKDGGLDLLDLQKSKSGEEGIVILQETSKAAVIGQHQKSLMPHHVFLFDDLLVWATYMRNK